MRSRIRGRWISARGGHEGEGINQGWRISARGGHEGEGIDQGWRISARGGQPPAVRDERGWNSRKKIFGAMLFLLEEKYKLNGGVCLILYMELFLVQWVDTYKLFGEMLKRHRTVEFRRGELMLLRSNVDSISRKKEAMVSSGSVDVRPDMHHMFEGMPMEKDVGVGVMGIERVHGIFYVGRCWCLKMGGYSSSFLAGCLSMDVQQGGL